MDPDEVEEFVYEDSAEFGWATEELSFEHHLAPSDEGGGVNGLPAIRGDQQLSSADGEISMEANLHLSAAEFRKAFDPGQAVVYCAGFGGGALGRRASGLSSFTLNFCCSVWNHLLNRSRFSSSYRRSRNSPKGIADFASALKR